MIHVSDMSWTRKVTNPADVLKKGQTLDAVVLEVDSANQRMSLGIKQLETDPWREIDKHYRMGDLVKGKVVKLASFGAFIELPDKLEGLVHISQIREERIEKLKDVLKVGEE
jgi:small subunit ribosomal protein S1